MTKYDHLVLCGSMAIDRIMSFSSTFQEHLHPSKLDAISLSFLMDTLTVSNGGVAGNIAYSLSLLGQTSTLLVTVGEDARGYISQLKKSGVDVSQVAYSSLPTSAFTVFTDRLGNQVSGFYPGPMKENRKLSFGHWQNTNTLVVISAHDPEAMGSQVKECMRLQLPYLYDVSQQVIAVSVDDLIEGLSHAQIVMVNEYEREVILKRTGIDSEKLTKMSPICITTLGEKGSVIEGSSVSQKIDIPATHPKNVVDPTGAGDAYRAGFLYGYNHNVEIEDCARLGSVVASFAVEHQGTQNHHFTKKICQQRFEETFKKTIKL